MAASAQDEFNDLMSGRNQPRGSRRHPEDDDDAASFLDSDSDDEDNPTPRVSTSQNRNSSYPSNGAPNPSQTSHFTVPNERMYSNTGPKGVISDAQAYREAQRTANRRPSTSTTTRAASQSQDRGRTFGELEAAERTRRDRSESGGLSELDEDDEVLARWRQDRMRELRSNHNHAGGSRRIGGSAAERAAAGRYGELVTVDGEGYLEAVDGSGSVTVVVVFIFDDRSEVSQLVEDCIRPLAWKYTSTRFVKLHYQEAEMEPLGVPAVLAYRAGDKFAGLVPLVNEIPDDAELEPLVLERLFQRHQIL